MTFIMDWFRNHFWHHHDGVPPEVRAASHKLNNEVSKLSGVLRRACQSNIEDPFDEFARMMRREKKQ